MNRKKYLSDVIREQFAKILLLLEAARKKTRPRKIDLYDVSCGVMYVIKSGCQWRMLPSDFPRWRTMHSYFQIWSEKKNKKTLSLLEGILKKIGRRRAFEEWQKLLHAMGIVDAQSVKNTDTAEEKGYDVGKKISGIKRHIVVDINGLPPKKSLARTSSCPRAKRAQNRKNSGRR